MGLFNAHGGHWFLRSETDPRWNCTGYVDRLIVMAGWTDEAKRRHETLRASYGEPPADLTYSCMKD